MSLCVGDHGWVAGIPSHGSVLLCGGWLITVEATGHPGHPPSTQLDAVVNNHLFFSTDMAAKGFKNGHFFLCFLLILSTKY